MIPRTAKSPIVFTRLERPLEALCASTAALHWGHLEGEGEVPWSILNHDEIGMMLLIGVYKPPKSSRMTRAQ